tara:strand:+ start:4842 stop:5156 length:315 start_codon:yes stop_codon:yes gene_type:complete
MAQTKAQKKRAIEGRKKNTIRLSEIDTNKIRASSVYDRLSEFDRQSVLHDVGIPKQNYEPYTRDDVVKLSKLNYGSLDKTMKRRISNRIAEISYNNIQNHGWTH